MRNCSVYLAGPIDGLDDHGREWREALTEGLPSGVIVFSPAHAYFGTSQLNAAELHFLNTAMLAACDVVVANLSLGVSLGTAREIEQARIRHKPTGLIMPGDYHDVHKSLMAYDCLLGGTFDEVLELCMEQLNHMRQQPRGIAIPFPFPMEPEDG